MGRGTMVTTDAIPARTGVRVAQMIGRSFRCGILARRELPAIGWSYAWQEIAGVTGPSQADRLVSVLGPFVESVDASAVRRIEVLPRRVRDCAVTSVLPFRSLQRLSSVPVRL